MTREQPELVAAFIHRLHQNGVRLEVLGEPGRERLRVRAPAGALSVDDHRRLARWKGAIIAALLAAGAGAGTDTDTDTDGAPPVDTDTTAADGKPVRKIGFIGKIPAPGAEAAGEGAPEPGEGEGEGEGGCPRCERLSRQAAEVMAQLQASPALPPALRMLSPEQLSILVRWVVLVATSPRPAWPPPRPSDARRRHRRPLDAVIADLGGRASGGEPPVEEPDDADDHEPAD
jgi:hypothetical protein